MRLFVIRKQKAGPAVLRTRCGLLSGWTGIAVNILLFALKLSIGLISGSQSVINDAVNNLSDAASSAVTVMGFTIAGKPADKEHPFGHGRVEYIAAIIIALAVLVMGAELVHSSIDRIRDPQELNVGSILPLIILGATILVKLWLAYFYYTVNKKAGSVAIRAVVKDSLSDTFATGVTMFALILARLHIQPVWFGYTVPVDGFAGLIVSLFIFAAGIGIVKDAVSPLLGEPPPAELVSSIKSKILSFPSIMGIHDLMIHNYGPGRVFASAHAEVSSAENIMESHDTIDLIEREIEKVFGISMVIHLDPIECNDERTSALKQIVMLVVKDIDVKLQVHDFRVVDGPTHTNLIFDLVTPHKFRYNNKDLIDKVSKRIGEYDSRYYTVITVEHSYL